MALTAAEKMRRYRERIKNDPEKYEMQRKKDLERVKQKRKKVAELNNTQKKKLREQWKNQKRRQRDKTKTRENNQTNIIKKQNKNDSSGSQRNKNDSDVTSKLTNLRKRYVCLSRKCKGYENRVNTLLTMQERLRKRHYRMKIESNKKLKQLENIIEKMKAREEMLEVSLKNTYKNCKKRSEQRLIKSLVTNARTKTYVAQLIGLTGRVRPMRQKAKAIEKNSEIVNFFLKDDVSRCTAGKKECKTKNKEKHQIRYLLDTLQNLYQKYRNEGGKFKFTSFHKHKPFYVLSPHLGSRNTCLCIKHNNIELKFNILKKHLILQNSLKEILASQSCDLKSYKCMHGKCNDCKEINLRHDANDEQLDQHVTWYQWDRIDHQYTKKIGTQTKTVTTKKTAKSEKTGTLRKLFHEFETDLIKFKEHYFNVYHQQLKYQTAVAELRENEALIICDFSENYETKLSEEIQSMHFGASKTQITLHTGMVYFKNKSQSFCTVSQNTTHQPPAIWAHLQPILKIIKEEIPKVSIIHFYSDGPTSQYRQKNNFYLTDLFTEQLKLDYTTWSYFESGHGKGVADGIGGSVKRVLDRQVCFGKDITGAFDAYKISKECMKTVKIWCITDEQINKISSVLPLQVPTLVGTMQLHQIITKGNGILAYRDISCFCGELKGLCNCFGTKTHRIRLAAACVNTTNCKEDANLILQQQTTSCLPAIEDIIQETEIDTNSPLVETEPYFRLEDSILKNEAVFESIKHYLPMSEDAAMEIEPSVSCLPMIEDIIQEIETDPNLPLVENTFPDTTNSYYKVATQNTSMSPDENYTLQVELKNLPVGGDTLDIRSEIRNLNLPVIEEIGNNILEQVTDLPVVFHDYPDMEISLKNDATGENKFLKQPIHVYKGNAVSLSNCKASSSSTKNLNQTIDLTASQKSERIPLKEIYTPKTLRTYTKRQFHCDGCKAPLTLNRIAKCMCCKKWFCWRCSGDQITIDYICDMCLEGTD